MTQTISNPTVEANVPAWTQSYCDALTENYKQYHIDSMKRMQKRMSADQVSEESAKPHGI